MKCPLCEEKMPRDADSDENQLKDEGANNKCRAFYCSDCAVEILVICY